MTLKLNITKIKVKLKWAWQKQTKKHENRILLKKKVNSGTKLIVTDIQISKVLKYKYIWI